MFDFRLGKKMQSGVPSVRPPRPLCPPYPPSPDDVPLYHRHFSSRIERKERSVLGVVGLSNPKIAALDEECVCYLLLLS